MWLGAKWGSNAGALREDEGGSRGLPRHWVLADREAEADGYCRISVSHAEFFAEIRCIKVQRRKPVANPEPDPKKRGR